MGDIQELLRTIPKVDEMLQDGHLVFFADSVPRPLIVDAVREVIEKTRRDILEARRESVPAREELIEQIRLLVLKSRQPSLRRVINATGVVLHTNLGRANLSEHACESVLSAAGYYSNLEYELESGTRGSRHDHVERLIKKITGAEAAMVVNNNAAATMLCLSALARGREVITSRGELVEIGGSFRIPEIMEESGARLVEVGATNKTKLSDYRRAFHEGETGALLKVHTSNYRIVGFTEEVTIKELSDLKEEYQVPVIYDMGSGLMADLRRYGVDEPSVGDALKQGADVVLFSGDKLFGGPQGGIIIGKKEYVERMKKHPMARAFRVDKMTLAALEATFYEYQDMDRAIKEIPVLRMITAGREELEDRAYRLRDFLAGILTKFTLRVEPCQDQVGGGSAPTVLLDGFSVTLSGEEIKAERVEQTLRQAKLPVIARVAQDKVWLSVRTIGEDEFSYLAEACKDINEVAKCKM